MKQNSSLIRLIAIGGLDVIKDIYLNIFLIARIYDLAMNPTRTIACYYIIVYALIPTTILIFGNYFKRRPVSSMRIGMLLNFALLIIIMQVDNKIISYYPLIATLFGIAMGTYYGPKQVLIGYYATGNSVNYCTISTIINNIVNVVFPITIGAYIQNTSFIAVTICILVVTGIELFITTKIKTVESQYKCDLRVFINLVKENKMRKAVYAYIIIFLGGIVSSVLDRTVLILILMLFGDALQLGILTTIFAGVTVLVSYLVKNLNKKVSRRMINISAVVPLLAVLMLITYTNTVTFIMYKAISSAFICILTLFADANRYDSIGELSKQYSTEHQSILEITLATGRITGFLGLLLVNEVIGEIIAIKVMLSIIGIVIVIYATLIGKVQNS